MSARSCAWTLDQLPLFAGGDLGSEPAEQVRQHLIDCHTCRVEAGALQRSTTAMRQLGADSARGAVVAGAGEEMFAAMHRSIVASVADHDVQVRRAVVPARALMVTAAAALLGAAGFWLARAEPESVWQRQPLASPAVLEEPALVVPYAGPRVELRPLGDEWWSDQVDENAPGSGMMGRGRLRTLVDEGMLLPEQRPR